MILLVSAGLLFKSFLHLRTTDLGCVTDNVLTVRYGLPEDQYNKAEQVVAFHETCSSVCAVCRGCALPRLVSTAPGRVRKTTGVHDP